MADEAQSHDHNNHPPPNVSHGIFGEGLHFYWGKLYWGDLGRTSPHRPRSVKDREVLAGRNSY